MKSPAKTCLLRQYAQMSRIRLALAAALVVPIVGTGIYVGVNQPLAWGSFGGPMDAAARRLTDGLSTTAYIIDTAPGRSVRLRYSVRNNAPLRITVHGVATDDYTADLQATWAPGVGREGLIGGDDDQIQSFPATLSPDEEIAVIIAVKKPRCGDGSVIIGAIPFRFSMLSIERKQWIPLKPGELALPVALCFPDAVRDHLLERF